MEKKQSSIEWLENEIGFILNTYSYNSQDFHLNKAFEQAKEMHKHEIKQSYREGRSDQQSKEIFYHRNSEQYYNETFGGDNE